MRVLFLSDMIHLALFLQLLFTVTAIPFQNGDPRNCRDPDSSIVAVPFDTLPGKGWDNLRNLDQSLVLTYNYSKCKFTSDGRFLVPDHIDAIPLRQSNQDISAELFTNKLDFSSSTSYSINAVLDVFSIINGRYSQEYERFGRTFQEQGGRSARIKLDHPRYTLKAQPSANLNKFLRNRIFQIAATLQINNTELAKYLSQLLIKDYGTHYIHTTTIGGILIKTDFLKADLFELVSKNRQSLEIGAHIDFKAKLNGGFNYSDGQSQELHFNYTKLITSSWIESHGGPLFTTKTYLSDWESGIEKEMAVINRYGDPLHTLITPYLLPDVPPSIVLNISRLVAEAAEKYYKVNTHKGCTDPSSENYDSKANIDDKSCSASGQTFKFGGVYQTCTSSKISLCKNIEQKNIATGTFSCPIGYQSIPLLSGKKLFTIDNPRCRDITETCGFLWMSRCFVRQICYSNFVTYFAEYRTFWCGATESDVVTNHLFGGIFSNDRPNPFTGSLTCPQNFDKLKLAADGFICMSNDKELGSPFAFPFAGFYSCEHGNPLASNTSNSSQPNCPAGYAQHLGMIDNDCEINYCLKAGVLSIFKNENIIRPPFMDLPLSILNKSRDYFLLASNGSIWVNRHSFIEDIGDDEWVIISNEDYSKAMDEMHNQGEKQDGENNLSVPPAAAGTIGALIILAVVLAITTVIFAYMWRRKTLI